MPLDLTKPVQTRDGRKVRILCTDSTKPNYPILALLGEGLGESIFRFTKDGSYFYDEFEKEQYHLDLINTPARIKRTVWLNLCKCENVTYAYTSEEIAKQAAKFMTCDAVAVKTEIDVEEGHGL